MTLEEMRAEVAEVLEVEPGEVVAGENIMDLGLDSIRLMVLAERWSERTGRTVEFAVLAEVPELESWWRYLNEMVE